MLSGAVTAIENVLNIAFDVNGETLYPKYIDLPKKRLKPSSRCTEVPRLAEKMAKTVISMHLFSHQDVTAETPHVIRCSDGYK